MIKNTETQNLSHIIIYVDENLPKTPFLAFCTKAKSERDDFWFTYICYDNQFEDMENLARAVFHDPLTDRKSVFLITDLPAALRYANENGIAAAALRTDLNRDNDLSSVLYCIEEIEYMSLERINRMWQRHFHIPWTIRVTDRMVIREHVMEDIEDLYDIYADRLTSVYMEDLYEDPEEEAEYLRKYIDNQYRFFEYGIWALTLKEDGKLIGRAGISMREGFDIPEIGYMIAGPYRGKGYATEAVRAVIQYGCRELGFEKYMAFTRQENLASIKVLERLGFLREGIFDIRGGEHVMYTLTKC